MDEDFTKKSTCLLCDAKVEPKSEVQICSTCAIIAMSDQDFQDLDYILLFKMSRLNPLTIKRGKEFWIGMSRLTDCV